MLADKKLLCELFGVSVRSLTEWTKEGMPVASAGGRGKSNSYDTVEVIAWHLERKVAKATEEGDFDPGSAQGAELIKERTRKTRADADMAEHKLQLARLEVVGADQVLHAWATLTADFRQAALQLPLRLAPMMLNISNIDAAKKLVENETNAMLTSLSRTPDYEVDLEALDDDSDAE
jgi:phage terminase Nu1 subunit (DNA packaging protein)